GIIDRFRAMDVRGETLINGHVVASVARNFLSAALVVAVALAIGFRPHGEPADWLAAIGILGLFVLALSWFAAAVGTLVRSPEAAQGITFVVSFLPYPSSAFVPVSTMPSWLRPFAANQPVSQVVDAIRALLAGRQLSEPQATEPETNSPHASHQPSPRHRNRHPAANRARAALAAAAHDGRGDRRGTDPDEDLRVAERRPAWNDPDLRGGRARGAESDVAVTHDLDAGRRRTARSGVGRPRPAHGLGP